MKRKKQLEKYYSQLVIEGAVRSAIIGTSIAFFVGFIVFTIGSFTAQNILLLGLVIIAVVSVITIVILYFFLYRPTMKTVAKRIDVLGFEERVVTMLELENDDCYIAEVQRKNTNETLGKFSLKLFDRYILIKPLLILLVAITLTGSSIGLMLTKVNAANQLVDPTIEVPASDDHILLEMINEIINIIYESNANRNLKTTLYGMVIDLEKRVSQYDSYLEKYTDILETRNEILQMLEDSITEQEESLRNIAEELQKYETTEVLGTAILTWDDNEIIAAFDIMYHRIDNLQGQVLYDEMMQTALDLEQALADSSTGTNQGIHDAIQGLADDYRLGLEEYQPGEEAEMIEHFKENMDQSLSKLLAAIDSLLEMIEELSELSEDIDDEMNEGEEFPIFKPDPQDGGSSEDSEYTAIGNTVIDGETPYEVIYDPYYDEAMEWVIGEDISEEIRQMIKNYFNMLK
ncbi:hypothetical protein KQ51_00147 [Candidatus Izimaplasma bacterium HR1]|uniref:hypothetical protein n=1 Tax=Candidatus Izimoplasma sp. HR1 TaxID=1541959 RepID=UPI0004F5DB7A|nr:hypothetical protein KQ51_00147 [Candidatus Izimaplasma bacterium HR1]